MTAIVSARKVRFNFSYLLDSSGDVHLAFQALEHFVLLLFLLAQNLDGRIRVFDLLLQIGNFFGSVRVRGRKSSLAGFGLAMKIMIVILEL